MITETLSPSYFQRCRVSRQFEISSGSQLDERHSALEVAGRLISDSALKVVFSYYPVCRCQRTSRSVHSKRQKKLNFDRFGTRLRLS